MHIDIFYFEIAFYFGRRGVEKVTEKKGRLQKKKDEKGKDEEKNETKRVRSIQTCQNEGKQGS
jgi:hypothetical protein